MAEYTVDINVNDSEANRKLKEVTKNAAQAGKPVNIEFKVPNLQQTVDGLNSVGKALEFSLNVAKGIPAISDQLYAIQEVSKGVTSGVQKLGTVLQDVIYYSNPKNGLVDTLTTAVEKTGTLIDSTARLGFTIFGVTQSVNVLGAAFGGLFQDTIGREIKLRDTLLSVNTTLAGTNKIIANGTVVKDVTKQIELLEGPVRKSIDNLRVKSLDIAGTTSEAVIQTFQVVASNIGTFGGSLKDAENLAAKFAGALGTLGMSDPMYARQEITSILQGNIDQNSVLAKTIGITGPDIQKAKTQAGGLMAFLEDRLKVFEAGQKKAALNFAGMTSNLQELNQELRRTFGAQFLDPMLDRLKKLYQPLAKNAKPLMGAAAGAGQLVSSTLQTTANIVTGGPIGGLFNEKNVETGAKKLEAAFSKATIFIQDQLAKVGATIKPVFDSLQKSAMALVKALLPIAETLIQLKADRLQIMVTYLSGALNIASASLAIYAKYLELINKILSSPWGKAANEFAGYWQALEKVGILPLTRMAYYGVSVIQTVRKVIPFVKGAITSIVDAFAGALDFIAAGFTSIGTNISATITKIASSVSLTVTKILAWVEGLVLKVKVFLAEIATSVAALGPEFEPLLIVIRGVSAAFEGIGKATVKAQVSVNEFSVSARNAMTQLEAKVAETGIAIQKLGTTTGQLAVSGMQKLVGSLKDVGIGFVKSMGAFLLWQVAITAVIAIIDELTKQYNGMITEQKHTDGMKALTGGLNDQVIAARTLGKELDATTKTLYDYHKAATLAVVPEMEKQLKETIIRIAELKNQLKTIEKPAVDANPLFTLFAPGVDTQIIENKIKELEKREKNVKKNIEQSIKAANAADVAKKTEESLELQARKNQQAIEDLAKFEKETRRGIEDTVYQYREQKAQKLVELYRAQADLELSKVEEKNRIIVRNADDNAQAALQAFANYMSVRKRGEVEIESKKREAQIASANLERSIAKMRLDLEDKILEVRKKMYQLEIDTLDQRLMKEQTIADIRNGVIVQTPSGGANVSGNTGLTMGSTGHSTGNHYHVGNAGSENEARAIFANQRDLTTTDRPGYSAWRGRDHNGYDLAPSNGVPTPLILAEGYRLIAFKPNQGGMGNLAVIEREADKKKYEVGHLAAAPANWSMSNAQGLPQGPGGGGMSANMAGYVKRIAYLESRIKNVPNSEGSPGQGYFQAFPKFTQEAYSASGGKNARSANYQEAAEATVAWIKQFKNKAAQAIEAGNYAEADRRLNKTWVSLPGGSQPQPANIQNKAREFLGTTQAPRAGTAPVPGAPGAAGANENKVTLGLSFTEIDKAIGALKQVDEQLLKISAEMNKEKTGQAWTQYIESLFDPKRLVSYEDALKTAKLELKSVEDASVGAFNPERAKIMNEYTMMDVLSLRKKDSIIKGIKEMEEGPGKVRAQKAAEEAYNKELEQNKKIRDMKLEMEAIDKNKAKTLQLVNDIEAQRLTIAQQLRDAEYGLKERQARTPLARRRLQAEKEAANYEAQLTKGGREPLTEKGLKLLQEYKDNLNAAAESLAHMDEIANNMKISDLMNSWNDELKDTQGQIVSLASTMKDEMSGAMSNAIMSVMNGTSTTQDAFKTMFQNIGASFLKMATEMIAKMLMIQALQLVTGLIGGGMGGGGGGFNLGGEGSGGSGLGAGSLYGQSLSGGSMGLPSFSDSFGSWAGGGTFGTRAAGGPVESNVPYLIGERGMEMFIPNSSGTIMPADRTAALLSNNRGALSGLASANVDPTDPNNPESGSSSSSFSSSNSSSSTVNNLFNSNRSTLTSINTMTGGSADPFSTNREVINTIHSTIKETARDAALGGSASVNVDYNVSRINSVDYVTAEEFRSGINQATTAGAKQGQQRALSALRNQPGVRRSVGMR